MSNARNSMADFSFFHNPIRFQLFINYDLLAPQVKKQGVKKLFLVKVPPKTK